MGVIWTPGKRERQPQAGVQIADRYQGALFSAIASQPRVPIRRSGVTTQIISSDGYSVGPGGAAWKVLNGSGTVRIILADSTGGANGPAIPAGGSWTAIWHCRLEALGAGNPGFFRSGSSSAGSTFVISNGSTGRPWIRVNGSDVLTPGSGPTFPLGLDTVFVVSMASGVRVDMAWAGAVQHSATHSATSGADQVSLFGWQGGATESIAGDYYSITWLPWAVSPGDAAILSTPAGYYGNVFEADNDPVFYSLGGGGGVSVDVPAGSVTLTGYAPTVTAGGAASTSVPAGAVTLTAYAPTVTAVGTASASVPLGTVAIAGYAPTVSVGGSASIDVPLGAVALTGYAPTVTTGGQAQIDVPLGTVALAGYAPTVTTTEHAYIAVPTAAMALAAYAPTVTASGAPDIWTPVSASTGTWTPQ